MVSGPMRSKADIPLRSIFSRTSESLSAIKDLLLLNNKKTLLRRCPRWGGVQTGSVPPPLVSNSFRILNRRQIGDIYILHSDAKPWKVKDIDNKKGRSRITGRSWISCGGYLWAGEKNYAKRVLKSTQSAQ